MLRSGHFSVYVVNFVKKKGSTFSTPTIGKRLGLDGRTHMGKCHYADSNQTFFKVMVRRLNNAIHKVRPDTGIPRFGNYKCEMVQNIPKQRPGSNDCAFYAMWYMEYYSADHGTVVFPYAVCVPLISCSHFYTMFYEMFIHGTRDRLLTFLHQTHLMHCSKYFWSPT
jgi:hypothetical protein